MSFRLLNQYFKEEKKTSSFSQSLISRHDRVQIIRISYYTFKYCFFLFWKRNYFWKFAQSTCVCWIESMQFVVLLRSYLSYNYLIFQRLEIKTFVVEVNDFSSWRNCISLGWQRHASILDQLSKRA